jgi:hypothetical protein
MSAAYKYACFQAFAIPTEGDNDADAQTHEVKAKVQTKPIAKKPEVSESEMAKFEEEFLEELRESALNGLDALQSAFLAIQPSELKTQFWTKHGEALKAAAKMSGAV